MHFSRSAPEDKATEIGKIQILQPKNVVNVFSLLSIEGQRILVILEHVGYTAAYRRFEHWQTKSFKVVINLRHKI